MNIPAGCELTEENLETLCSLEKSKNYIALIIIAIAVAYHSVDIEQERLIASVCEPDRLADLPDVFPFEIFTNVSTLIAVYFFYCLSGKTLKEDTNPDNCISSYDFTASALVLIATMIRLYSLLRAQETADANNNT